MSNALAALALLKLNWDYNRRDYFDSLLPLFATVLARRAYVRVDPDKMCRAFKNEWGWEVPHYVMQGLMARAQSVGLIEYSELGDWVPVHAALAERQRTDASAAAEAQVDRLADAYVEYCRARDETLERPDAVRLLLAFLAQYDLEVVSAHRNGGLLSFERATDAEIFSVGAFFLHCYSERKDLFEAARQLALAQVFVSTISAGVEGYDGTVEGLFVYLDTRVLLQALGVYGDDRKTWVREMFADLRHKGARLRVFDHTFEETESILANCKPYVSSVDYNPSLASHACRYFREIGATESDVEEVVIGLRASLEEIGVEYFQGEYDPKDNEFQIGEEDLRTAILESYRARGGLRVLNDETIRRDVRSISLVHRMRHGMKPHRLSEAQHVFVTANAGLARAAYDVQVAEDGQGVVIPDVVKDAFLATTLWLQAPSEFEVVDTSRFLADCHAAMEVDDELVARFLGKVDQLKERGELTEAQYYELRMHRYAMRVLADATLGDLDNVTDDTPLEVLARIEDRLREEAEQKYREEHAAHLASVSALEAQLRDHEREQEDAAEHIADLQRQVTDSREEQSQIVDAIAGLAAGVLVFPLALVFIVASAFAFFFDAATESRFVQVSLKATSIVLLSAGLLSLLTGFNVLGLKRRVQSMVAKRIRAMMKRPQSS